MYNISDKISNAKIELGTRINPAALCYLNLAETVVDDTGTSTLRLDASIPGKIELKVNSEWLASIAFNDLTMILHLESARIALRHITSRDTHKSVNLYASDHIVYKFGVGGLRLSTTSISDAFIKSGMSELYDGAVALYKETTGQEWNPDDETLERLAYWMQMFRDSVNENADESSGASDDKMEGDSTSNDSPVSSDGELSEQTALNRYFSDTTRDNGWTENEGIGEIVKDITNTLNDNGVLGLSSWGSGHLELLSSIIAANNKIRYDKILRSFVRNVISSEMEPTRMKVNRRYGLRFPGYRSTYKQKLLILTDSSGSMSDFDLSMAVDLILTIAKYADVYFSWWDTKCTIPQKIENSDIVNNVVDVTGRGGTDVSCVFEMLKENHLEKEFSGLIIFSDMMFATPDKPTFISQNRMLWIPTTSEATPPWWVKKNRIMPCRDMINSVNEKNHI